MERLRPGDARRDGSLLLRPPGRRTPTGNTQVLLHNPAAMQGVGLKFNLRQLPCFTIWKNREAVADGYVTGLEPATNYPNTKTFEKSWPRRLLVRGRVAAIELEIAALKSAAEVRSATEEIQRLQRGHTGGNRD